MRALGDWLLTARRVAVHVPTSTAVAADLHLGHGLARRRSGEAVPAPPLAAQLEPLRLALERQRARRLVLAGDVLEDGRCGRDELVEGLLGWLATAGVELVGVVRGNHDRGLAWVGKVAATGSVELGGWRVVHGDGERPAGPVVQGHEHPWARWGPGLGGACYLFAPGHLVLPAYSPDAAGVNVLGARRWADYRCAVIAGDEVLDFGPVGGLRR